MRLTRRPILALAGIVLLLAAWSAIRSGDRDVAVLRTFDVQGQDYFTTVWLVEDPEGFVWIRAHRPDRAWLSQVRERPQVTLGRAGRSQNYVAKVFDDAATRRYVAPRFREKYGLADRWREWSGDADTVPIRLRAR